MRAGRRRLASFRILLQVLPLTSFATFLGTLLACRATFISEGPHGGIVRFPSLNGSMPVNFTEMWESCVDHLCDISAYGGWPQGDREHRIFVGGFIALAAQLAILVAGRLALVAAAASPAETNPHVGCCCGRCHARPLRVASACGFGAIFLLLPMAYFKFYDFRHPVHFLSAFLLFILLAVAEMTDAALQLRLIQRGDALLSRNQQLLVYWNRTFSVGGLALFAGWLCTQLSILEWLAASLPFFYFLPWSFQVNWLWDLSCGAQASTASAADTLISLPGQPVFCVQATQALSGLTGNSVRVAGAAGG